MRQIQELNLVYLDILCAEKALLNIGSQEEYTYLIPRLASRFLHLIEEYSDRVSDVAERHRLFEMMMYWRSVASKYERNVPWKLKEPMDGESYREEYENEDPANVFVDKLYLVKK